MYSIESTRYFLVFKIIFFFSRTFLVFAQNGLLNDLGTRLELLDAAGLGEIIQQKTYHQIIEKGEIYWRKLAVGQHSI